MSCSCNCLFNGFAPQQNLPREGGNIAGLFTTMPSSWTVTWNIGDAQYLFDEKMINKPFFINQKIRRSLNFNSPGSTN